MQKGSEDAKAAAAEEETPAPAEGATAEGEATTTTGEETGALTKASSSRSAVHPEGSVRNKTNAR